MFKDLLNRLMQPAPDTLAPDDARLALTALLVRLARADHDYGADEQDRIDRILQTRYELDLAGSEQLRLEGEALEAEAPDTVRFTRAIKDAVAYEDRTSVIEALWQVALADGQRAAEEDAVVRLAANLLGVSDVDSALSRQRVEQSL